MTLRFLAALTFLTLLCPALQAQNEAWTPIEQHVADIAAGDKVTVVHFWAPWCPNCNAELAKGGWRDFLGVNQDINVVFVTIWSEQDGKAELLKNGVGEQPNFQLLHHPNPSKTKADRVNTFLRQPIDWIPTTWVFKSGHLRYALNYGEVRFPLLQQLVRDAGGDWKQLGPIGTKR